MTTTDPRSALVPEDLLDIRFRGLAMPTEKKPGGFFHKSYTKAIIRSSIIMIMMTRPGERVMLPEFGSRLWLLVFEPNDVILRNLAQRYIIDDLARWEPRVRVTGIRTTTNLQESELRILIDYEITSISVADAVTLVFRREGVSTQTPESL